MPDSGARFGFPPGVARAKVLETIKFFEDRTFHLFPDDKKVVEDAIRAAKSNEKTASQSISKTKSTGAAVNTTPRAEARTQSDSNVVPQIASNGATPSASGDRIGHGEDGTPYLKSSLC